MNEPRSKSLKEIHERHEAVKTYADQWPESQVAIGRNQRRLERLESAIRQLAKAHPDTPVTWMANDIKHYMEIRDWAAWVLAEEWDG